MSETPGPRLRALKRPTRWGVQPLRAVYRGRGLTVWQLADLLGRPAEYRHVYNVSVGATLPTVATADGLARALGCELSELFTLAVVARVQDERDRKERACYCGDGPFKSVGGLHLHQTVRHGHDSRGDGEVA